MIGRMFTGESLFLVDYSVNSGTGVVAFASEFPGKVVPIDLAQGQEIVAQKDAFMCAEKSVDVKVHFRKKLGAGFFGGEGFIMQKFTGPGLVFAELDGELAKMKKALGPLPKVGEKTLAKLFNSGFSMKKLATTSLESALTVEGLGETTAHKILDKAADLAWNHSLSSVVVGLAGFEGDLLFPEVVDFVESALRVDDSIFRMTRERVVLVLADVDRVRGEEIIGRLLAGFRERFGPVAKPTVSLGYFEVTPETKDVSVKEALLAVFSAPSAGH